MARDFVCLRLLAARSRARYLMTLNPMKTTLREFSFAARCVLAGLLAAVCLLVARIGHAEPAGADEEYPTKAIRIVVASSVGAADDFFARLLADELAKWYRRRVLVENRPGAGGLIGNMRVSRANADGYTLGMVGVTRLITELMREQAPYRALADIVGVAHVASITNVLVVSRTLPVATARDFVSYARGRPGELNYASLGIGSASHLAAEVFSRALRIDAVHIPFRVASDSFVEMSLGRVHYAIYTLPLALGPIRDQRLRPLAVMTPERSRTLPQVPSIVEVGLPEAQYDSWSGIVAPTGTSRRIVEQLHGDITRVLRNATLRQRFYNQGAESTPDSTPDSFMRHMQEEYTRFQSIIRSSSVRAD
jgi:tripartite-type tricarboxylate transporter receptor subunit TctC